MSEVYNHLSFTINQDPQFVIVNQSSIENGFREQTKRLRPHTRGYVPLSCSTIYTTLW